MNPRKKDSQMTFKEIQNGILEVARVPVSFVLDGSSGRTGGF